MSKMIKNYWRRHMVAIALFGCLALVVGSVLVSTSASAGGGKNGTTLAAVKTIDICDKGDGTWHYSGEIAVWNEGAVNTVGLAIQDCIQNKTGSGQFQNAYCGPVDVSAHTVILAATTSGTATLFAYSFNAAPLAGDIRNVANVTITNHSGQPAGTPFGPSPKSTWTGGTPQACASGDQCTYSQGYWKTHPDDWPDGYLPTDSFFLSGQTWQYYLDHPGGNGYNILATQYIGAVLNKANGSSVPASIQTILDQASAWFSLNGSGACSAAGSCGTQKDWAKILESYNLGCVGPGHCGGPEPDYVCPLP
jgi:hypothetical protein